MNVKIPELLAPAGSPEGVRAAVQSGAGAVYMGFGTFNARRNAQGFSHEEMADAIAYCRARNVKSNITLNILVGDRELDDALEDAKFLYEAGADALIVQDLGLARLIHAHAPDFALHASTQMTIHTLDGARQARDIGFSRVVLSRECTREQIERSRARQASRPRCSSTAHCACAIRVSATCPPSSGSVRATAVCVRSRAACRTTAATRSRSRI